MYNIVYIIISHIQNRMMKNRLNGLVNRQMMRLSKSEQFMKLEEQYGCHNYAPLDVVLSRAEGAVVWDSDGK